MFFDVDASWTLLAAGIELASQAQDVEAQATRLEEIIFEIVL